MMESMSYSFFRMNSIIKYDYGYGRLDNDTKFLHGIQGNGNADTTEIILLH